MVKSKLYSKNMILNNTNQRVAIVIFIIGVLVWATVSRPTPKSEVAVLGIAVAYSLVTIYRNHMLKVE